MAVMNRKRVPLLALVLCCGCCAWGVLGRTVCGIVARGELNSSSVILQAILVQADMPHAENATPGVHSSTPLSEGPACHM